MVEYTNPNYNAAAAKAVTAPRPYYSGGVPVSSGSSSSSTTTSSGSSGGGSTRTVAPSPTVGTVSPYTGNVIQENINLDTGVVTNLTGSQATQVRTGSGTTTYVKVGPAETPTAPTSQATSPFTPASFSTQQFANVGTRQYNADVQPYTAPTGSLSQVQPSPSYASFQGNQYANVATGQTTQPIKNINTSNISIKNATYVAPVSSSFDAQTKTKSTLPMDTSEAEKNRQDIYGSGVEGAKKVGVGFLEGAGEFVGSLGRGVAKSGPIGVGTTAYIQASGTNVSQLPKPVQTVVSYLSPTKAANQSWFSAYTTDPDIQLTAGTAAVVGIGAIAPEVGVGLGYTFFGVQAAQTLENPSPENIKALGPYVVLPLAGKAIEMAPKPAVRDLAIYQEGKIASTKLYGIETPKGNALVIASKGTGEPVRLGVGSVPEKLAQLKSGGEIKPSTPLETKAIQTSLQKLPAEAVADVARTQQAIPTAKAILQQTKGVESKYVQETFPRVTERLPEEGVNIALSQAKKYEGFIAGSYSRSAQLAPTYKIGGVDYTLSKTPRDIDIHLAQEPAKIQAIAEETVTLYKKAGIDARLVSEGGKVKNAIEVKMPGKDYEKAVEFLGEGTIPAEEITPEFVLGLQKKGKPTTIEGIQTSTLSEELRGVTQGVIRVRKTEQGIDVFPPEKRVKDIGSVVVSARTLAESKVFKGPLIRNIEKFESLYPKEKVLEQVSPTTKPGKVADIEKKLLADYRKTNQAVSPTQVISSSYLRPIPSGTPSAGILRPTQVSQYQPSTVDRSPRTPSTSYRVPSTSNTSTISNKPSAYSPYVTTPSDYIISPTPSPITTSPYITSPTTPSPSEPSPNVPSSTEPSPIQPSPQAPSPNVPSPFEPSPITPSPRSPSPRTGGSDILPSVPKPIKPFIVTTTSPKKKKGSFYVEVRRKGKFGKVGGFFESEKEALGFGSKIVASTAAATFKVLASQQGPTQRYTAQMKPQDFYVKSEQRTGATLYIQKASKRISSAGELREITYKGIAASRQNAFESILGVNSKSKKSRRTIF